jgi:hypothetical protein
MAGVLVMIVLFVTATGYLTRDRRPASAPDPVWPFGPGTTDSPSARPDASAAPSVAATPSRRPPASSRPTSSTTTPSRATPSRSVTPTSRPPASRSAPSSDGLTGRYRVTNDWNGGFIAEVLLRNDGTAARQWTVELRFPPDVKRLVWYWTDGASRPVARRAGESYLFTGVDPLPAGATLRLGMQFDADDRENRPTACTVNGVACALG